VIPEKENFWFLEIETKLIARSRSKHKHANLGE
jgi:hypothetical protein